MGDHITPLADLVSERARWRDEGRRVVLTNGCFDLLHVGHLTLLEAARAEGDVLVVALNSDASVRGLKGEGRPLIPQEERAEVLHLVQEIADAQGDVDTFIAQDDEKTKRVPKIAAEIAKRLLAADRAEEALQAIDAAETAATIGRISSGMMYGSIRSMRSVAATKHSPFPFASRRCAM